MKSFSLHLNKFYLPSKNFLSLGAGLDPLYLRLGRPLRLRQAALDVRNPFVKGIVP